MARLRGHSLEEQDALAEQFVLAVEHSLALVVDKLAERVAPAVTASLGPDDASAINELWNGQVDEILLPQVALMYESGGIAVAFDAAHSLKLPEGQGIPTVTSEHAQQYIASLGNKLRNVGNELWEDVRGELAAGAADGESIEELAARVRNAADFTHARAAATARTTVVAASNAGSYATAQLLGEGVKKVWEATDDARTRPTHAETDGQVRDIDAYFDVGGSQLSYPGDPGGPADEVINCRCTLVYDFDENNGTVNTCECGVTAAALAFKLSHKPVVSGFGTATDCACPTTPGATHVPAPTGLSPEDETLAYTTFKKPGNISPAYGGAKIYKHLQEAIPELQQISPNVLGKLDEFQLLEIVDKIYAESGGKSSFLTKFEEWVQSAAGKKATGGLEKSVAKTVSSIDEAIAQNVSKIVTEAPSPLDPLSIGHISDGAKAELWKRWQDLQKVTPGWGGAKIFKNLQALKPLLADSAELSQLNDGQLLKILDDQWLVKGKSGGKTFYDETMSWLQSPQGKKYVEKAGLTTPPVGKEIPKPSATETLKDAGKLGDISGVSDAEKQTIFNKFKQKGVYLTSQPSKMYDAVQNLQELFGYEYTELQIIRMVDEQGALKLGVANANLYEKKLVAWLKTPAGKKYVTEASMSAAEKAAAAAAKAAKKAEEAAKPFEMEAITTNISTTDTTFSEVSVYDAQKLQDSYTPWTASQRASLRYYTSNNYTQMNRFLRGQQNTTPAVKNHIKNAQAGMRPSTRPMLLHRGCGLEQLGLHAYSSLGDVEALVGKTMQDKGFMSTSVGGHAAFGGKVLLEIEAPTGTPMAFVKSISHYNSENEMLLAAGTKYKVISVKQDGYKYVVRVRVVP